MALLGLVKVPKIYKGLMTSADKQVFSNVKLTQNGSEIVIQFDYDDETYFRGWMKRVNGSEITGKDTRKNYLVKNEVGSLYDRLSDSFAFNQLNLLFISNIYNILDETTKNSLPADLKKALDDFIAFRAANPELFPMDLDDEELTGKVNRVVGKEKKVKDIIKKIDAEEDDI